MRVHRVTVEPSGVAFDVAEGETVIQAAWRAGLYWPTVCNGQGSCRSCVLSVVTGPLSSVEPWEQEGLDAVTPTLPGHAGPYRLACQARPAGDVVVRKVGVRPA